MRISIIIAISILIIGTSAMLGSGYRLLETNRMYAEADDAYENMSNTIRQPSTEATPVFLSNENVGISAVPPERNEQQIHIPDFEINFELLHLINNDAAAWLYSPGTVIDYPVMRADDYRYYLNHLADGTVNANGSLFIDYNNAADFSEPLTVIYGHHMKSGSMLGSLKGYKAQSYYNEHPYMYLYTKQGNYRIDIMYGCVVAEGQWREQSFMYSDNIDALLEYALQNTTFRSDVSYQEGDRVVALSTCSYEFDDARYVLIGVLRFVP